MEKAPTPPSDAAPHDGPDAMAPDIAKANNDQLLFCHPPYGDRSWTATGWMQPIQDVNFCPEVNSVYAPPIMSFTLYPVH